MCTFSREATLAADYFLPSDPKKAFYDKLIPGRFNALCKSLLSRAANMKHFELGEGEGVVCVCGGAQGRFS